MSVTVRVRSIVWFATGVALTLASTVLVMSAWRADAAPGADETTFVPIAPCRLFDYRPSSAEGPRSTPVGPAETVIQQITGAVGACNIPPTASGVAMNVTVTDSTAASNLRIFPADVAVPNASNLNWSAGQQATPNKVDVKLSPTGAVGIYNAFGDVYVLADATGYYTRTGLADLQNQIDVLKKSRSFAVHSDGFGAVTLSGTTSSVVRSVTITAPVAGSVTVNSSHWAYNNGSAFIGCAITTATSTGQSDGAVQRWHHVITSDGVNQPMAATRGFSIAAGQTVKYNLVCVVISATGNSSIENASLTAIFTPNP